MSGLFNTSAQSSLFSLHAYLKTFELAQRKRVRHSVINSSVSFLHFLSSSPPSSSSSTPSTSLAVHGLVTIAVLSPTQSRHPNLVAIVFVTTPFSVPSLCLLRHSTLVGSLSHLSVLGLGPTLDNILELTRGQSHRYNGDDDAYTTELLRIFNGYANKKIG